MSVENLDGGVVDTSIETNDQDETQQETGDTTQVSHYEQEAREMGWRPKDEWDGDPEKWRDSKEFVERGELYGKIDTMGKELKETRKALKMLQEHHTKVKETEYKRAVEELKALQKKHLESGDSDGYIETTELLTDLRAEQKAREVVAETQPKNQIDPRFVDWAQSNSWYEKNQDMRDYADIIGQGYASKNPGIDPELVLKYVTREVKSKFKDSFQNPNRERSAAVEGETPRGVAKGKTSFELTEDERKVMNTFVRQGILTKEEYIEQVKQLRGNK